MDLKQLTTLDLGGGLLAPALADGRAIDLSALSRADMLTLRGTGAENVLLTNPMVTALVLGQMSKRVSFVNFVSAPLFVERIKVDYPTWPNNEWIERHDTRRAESAPYKTTRPEPSKATITLDRRSWGVMADIRVLENQSPGLRLREKYALMSARLVELDIQYLVRDLMDAAASYTAGHNVAIAGGSEWDVATVDPRDDVDAAIDLITAKVFCQPSDLKAFIPHLTQRAIYRNPNFRSWNEGQQARVSGNPPTQLLADFFGIGEVLAENPFGKDAGTVGSLFSDNFYLFLPGVGGEYDTEFGEERWMGHLRKQTGIASEPFLLPDRTSWVWPWDVESEHLIFNNQAGFRYSNCAS